MKAFSWETRSDHSRRCPAFSRVQDACGENEGSLFWGRKKAGFFIGSAFFYCPLNLSNCEITSPEDYFLKARFDKSFQEA
jgi:hypothetical protein